VTVPHFHNPKVKKESTVRAALLVLLAALFFTSLETASAQPPAKPAELKVFDRLDGKWRYEWRTEPGGLLPPAQITTKGLVPGMKKPTRLVTRVRAQETLPLCQRCVLSTRTIAKRPV
jgi:hypothetical protein